MGHSDQTSDQSVAKHFHALHLQGNSFPQNMNLHFQNHLSQTFTVDITIIMILSMDIKVYDLEWNTTINVVNQNTRRNIPNKLLKLQGNSFPKSVNLHGLSKLDKFSVLSCSLDSYLLRWRHMCRLKPPPSVGLSDRVSAPIRTSRRPTLPCTSESLQGPCRVQPAHPSSPVDEWGAVSRTYARHVPLKSGNYFN